MNNMNDKSFDLVMPAAKKLILENEQILTKICCNCNICWRRSFHNSLFFIAPLN